LIYLSKGDYQTRLDHNLLKFYSSQQRQNWSLHQHRPLGLRFLMGDDGQNSKQVESFLPQKSIRWILNINMHKVEANRITNKQVQKQFLHIPDIIDVIHYRQLKWSGKIVRMDKERAPQCPMALGGTTQDIHLPEFLRGGHHKGHPRPASRCGKRTLQGSSTCCKPRLKENCRPLLTPLQESLGC
jgi:hypothetical protein